jgi:signal transduction histidine kinase
MNAQREFMSETFHVLAQPITVLRARVEIGLTEEAENSGARQIFQECLGLIDRLMEDLAVFREIASLDEEPPLELCDGRTLLESCIEDLAPVAEECGVAFHLSIEDGEMRCNKPMLQRAIFILLDAMIAGTARGDAIRIALSPDEEGLRLELRPGAPPGRRQDLCRKLMQFAGGSGIQFDSARSSVTFQGRTYRQGAAETSAD